MKMFPKSLSVSALALAAAAMIVPAAAHADGENVGDTQQCVNLKRTNSTSVVDDSTILITMRGKDEFKRIDMRTPCHGLEHSGFNVTLREDKICTYDTLTVRRAGGNACQIEKIVTINETEAAALKAR